MWPVRRGRGRDEHGRIRGQAREGGRHGCVRGSRGGWPSFRRVNRDRCIAAGKPNGRRGIFGTLGLLRRPKLPLRVRATEVDGCARLVASLSADRDDGTLGLRACSQTLRGRISGSNADRESRESLGTVLLFPVVPSLLRRLGCGLHRRLIPSNIQP